MTTMAEPATTDLNQLDAFHALLPALRARSMSRRVSSTSARSHRDRAHDEANVPS